MPAMPVASVTYRKDMNGGRSFGGSEFHQVVTVA